MLGPNPTPCQQYLENATCIDAERVDPFVYTHDVGNGSVSYDFNFETWLCNMGYHLNGAACSNAYYILPLTPPDTDPCDCTKPATPKPVSPGSGNERWSEIDYSSGDKRLVFSRSYNSSNVTTTSLSPGWQSNFLDRRLVPLDTTVRAVLPLSYNPATACTSGAAGATYLGSMQCQLPGGKTVPVYSTDFGAPWNSNGISGVVVQQQDGSMTFFGCTRSSCTANSDISLRLTPNYYRTSTNEYSFVDSNDTVEVYDSNGRLTTVTYRDGYKQFLTYSGNLLQSVSDSFGRTLSMAYNTQNQLLTVTTPDGLVQYGYDSAGRLSTVTYPDSSIRTYQYTNTSYSNLLTGIIDESSNAFLSTSYDSAGRATESGLAGGVEWSGVDYTDPANPIVTDARGVARTYHYTTVNGYQKISSITGATTCLTCNAYAATGYDAAGYLRTTTDWNGNVTNYIYDDSRGLETSRIEAVGTAQQRTITTTWHPTFRLPAEIDEPGRQTTFTYDSSGNLLTKSVKDTATNATRIWTYSNYTSWGAPQTIDGPRTDVSDVTQIAYYPIVGGDAKSGQINTITDALGHVTTVNSYDPSGRPLQVTDPNGLVTVYTYKPRGWLASRQVGSELTQYDYWPTGLLKKLTLPDGAYLQYSYNAAHQLTDNYDQLGDHIHYTPDVMGNNTQVQVYGPSGTLVQTHSRVYNTLNELYQDVGAYTGEVTQYGYDNNGNRTSVSDPLSHVTQSAYDALDRLYQVTDPALNNTSYYYDPLDQLSAVTDPRSLSTVYTRDALGSLKQTQSPDSGTGGATYDAAGNMLTRTDAKNQTTHYQYDALNRLVLETRADNSTVSYSYDQGSNGIGRRTGMTDPSGSTSWSYDVYGHVVQKTAVVSGTSLTTIYNYDSATGHLLSMSLPSATMLGWTYNPSTGTAQQGTMPFHNTVGYTWTNGQITALTLGGNPLVSNIAWQPFGGPKSWTFANGEPGLRSYDLDGRVSATELASIGYDHASRVTNVNLNGSVSFYTDQRNYGYDALNRLIHFDDNTGDSDDYIYDANGNISSNTYNVVPNVGTRTFSIDPNSNRILSINGQNLSYDANGSLTSYGYAYTYDTADRLASQSPFSYTHNGLGQLVWKGGINPVNLYAYDEAGHLIGEYEPGLPLQETVWLGDIPLAVIQPEVSHYQGHDAASLAIGGNYAVTYPYYVHTDHLNTPQQIDDVHQYVAWIWWGFPYGDPLPETNPYGDDSDPGYNFSPRFPGQVYVGYWLSANGYRDYAINLGRYLESDPIGLGGGINTYAYARANPLRFIDPLGLNYAESWGAAGAIAGGGVVAAGSVAVDAATGGINILATPAEISAGAAGGGAIGYSVGSGLDWLSNTYFNKPPQDAADSDGAKAPGLPGAEDGYVPPKGGPQWVPNPNPGKGGSSNGWLDKKGRVWCPTGKGGRAHGGPHWDVQTPGGGNENVYPQ